jgi:cytochrome c biogenesis protein CcdA/thiol-disulfide isomerase/thioredoxin
VTLILIGLAGGIITGVTPCVLPVLPVVLLGSGTAGADGEATRRRPYLVVLGLVLSFAVFTLFGDLILDSLHLPDDAIRWIGLVLLVLIGLGLLIPQLGHLLERPFYRFPNRIVGTNGNGFVLGIALGAVFVPCAGPVLAAITVAGATGHIGWDTIRLTAGFAAGAGIPLMIFALAGRGLSQRIGAFQRHQGAFRTASGVVMIALAVALTFNLADIIQDDIPNYAASVANSLERGASAATQNNSSSGGSGAVSLQDCQTAAEYGGTGTALEDCGAAPAFAGIQQWFNTANDKPVTIASLKGKVVLIDFWAYSCINCQRELPHVEAWAKNYAKDGLVVVGVHTPEYAFEHVASNVQAGAKRLGLTFPVALDNNYGTWDAYDNQSWPASYLIDASGTIRHVSIGEGDYPAEEQDIRQLLTAARPGITLPKATEVADTTPTNPSQTSETYLGAERAQFYDGSVPYKAGTHQFTAPASLAANEYSLTGTWTLAQEEITALSGATITESYDSSYAYLDVGGTGTLTVTSGGATKTIKVSGAPDIYTVASASSPANRTVSIKLSPGLQAYSFTFG